MALGKVGGNQLETTLNIDSGTLYVDGTNNRVGVGTTSPSAKLDVRTTGQTAETVSQFGNLNIQGGLQVQTNGNLDWGFNALNSRNLTFSTNQTERMRILSSGGITFNGDTAAANALDDYEEGTWTISTVGGTGVSGTAASYTKVGRLVTFDGSFTLNTNSSGAHLTIQGLPFTANASTRGAAMIRYTNFSATSNFSMHVNGSDNKIGFYLGSGPIATETQFSGKRVDFAGFYYT